MILFGATDVYWLVRQTDCKTKIGKESMGKGGQGQDLRAMVGPQQTLWS